MFQYQAPKINAYDVVGRGVRAEGVLRLVFVQQLRSGPRFVRIITPVSTHGQDCPSVRSPGKEQPHVV